MADTEAVEFVPCPMCGQYSHSIPDDKLAEAFRHFQSMYAHPLRGTPMGHNFDEQTRDYAQVLVAAASRTPPIDVEAVARAMLHAHFGEDDWANVDPQIGAYWKKLARAAIAAMRAHEDWR